MKNKVDDERYDLADQYGMSHDYADWFFDNKKEGCGNVWFIMFSAMWEGWKVQEEKKEKTINFLIDQLSELANFNPDWDKLEAATDSLREHMEALTKANKTIAELSSHLKSAHAFIETTEAFGHEASSGILKCGGTEWNIDASKDALRRNENE